MFTIEVKPKEKVILSTLSGFISREEGMVYIIKLKEKINSINPKEYINVVDTQDLKAAPQDALDLMKQSMDIIRNTPFKQNFNIMSKSSVTNSQAHRIGKEDDFFNKTIQVKSYKDIAIA